MRKEYSKPELIMESFELTEHISAGCGVVVEKTGEFGNPLEQAGGCGVSVSFLTEKVCNVKDGITPQSEKGPFKVFAEGSKGCEQMPQLIEGYCYTTGVRKTSIFTS